MLLALAVVASMTLAQAKAAAPAKTQKIEIIRGKTKRTAEPAGTVTVGGESAAQKEKQLALEAKEKELAEREAAVKEREEKSEVEKAEREKRKEAHAKQVKAIEAQAAQHEATMQGLNEALGGQ